MKYVCLILICVVSTKSFCQTSNLKLIERKTITSSSSAIRPLERQQMSTAGFYVSDKQLKSLLGAGGLHYTHKQLLYGNLTAMSKTMSKNSFGKLTKEKALRILIRGRTLAKTSGAKYFTLGVTAVGGYFVVKDWFANKANQKVK